MVHFDAAGPAAAPHGRSGLLLLQAKVTFVMPVVKRARNRPPFYWPKTDRKAGGTCVSLRSIGTYDVKIRPIFALWARSIVPHAQCARFGKSKVPDWRISTRTHLHAFPMCSFEPPAMMRYPENSYFRCARAMKLLRNTSFLNTSVARGPYMECAAP
jgi:hypothetical protein